MASSEVAASPPQEELGAAGALSTAHRVGFAFLALFLVAVALASSVDVGVLVPASLVAFAVGLILVTRGNRNDVARATAFGVLAYLVVVALAFVAATPITLGKSGYWVNGYPPPVAEGVVRFLIGLLPFVLAAGVGVITWPMSPRSGRVLVVVAGVLLASAVLLGAFATPKGTDAVSVEDAARMASLATNAFAAACLALTGAIALGLFGPKPAA